MATIKMVNDVSVITHESFLDSLTPIAALAGWGSLKTICGTGGASAAYVNKDQLILAAHDPAITPEQSKFILDIPSGYCINLYEDFLVNHSEVEKQAIYYHEMGHVAFKHVPETSEVVAVTTVLDNMGYELEADHFSAKKVGNRAMHGALIKTIDTSINITGKVFGLLGKAFAKEVFLEAAMTNETVVARLKALAH